MSIEQLTILPGVCKVNSPYASSLQFGAGNGRIAAGRWTDTDKVRFVAGFPEKIGGWNLVASGMLGVPRGMLEWRDNSENVWVGIGTNYKLYTYSDGMLTDITPLRGMVTGTLTDPFTTTLNSATVKVTSASHGLQTGDHVMLTASSSVGGLLIAGVYSITVLDANNYNITASTTASSGTTGGGSTAYVYYRITLTNPFTTQAGSAVVTVSLTNNGCSAGDYIFIAGATAVGGLTLAGSYQITNASTNSFTITAASTASSGATGGGTPNFLFDIPAGNADASVAFGYGTGSYGGSQGYGSPSSGSGYQLYPRVWCLSNYGQQLLANPTGLTIYVWDPTTQGRAYPLYNAPSTVLAMFVTPERFVFALGIDGNLMQVAWPDQTDDTDWTSTATNTANEGRTLQGGNFLIGGVPVRDGASMVFSNTNAFSFVYSGDNFVYDSNNVASGAGLIGPLAGTVLGGVVYYMSDKDFWTWSGTTQPLPSDDIRDYVFSNINTTQQFKCVASTNRIKKEIWFFYPSSNSEEIDSYAIYHVDQGVFSLGTMERTSWVDSGLLTYPLATDASGNLYEQEYGLDANGAALPYTLTWSPVEIAKGQYIMDVMAYYPDFERLSQSAELSLLAQDYPMSTGTGTYGPYAITTGMNPARIDFRISTRMLSGTLTGTDIGCDFRLGVPRFNMQQGPERI